ncbi:MAG TPA: hypothetical protein OIM45_08290 [Clostridiaceae bacterium]|jgi:hypothetical protein|nr:hypothetical protein [Clostridiaceae bacterium]HJJ05813.1 hypothetical protein [Clostridiaceae bacterium]
MEHFYTLLGFGFVLICLSLVVTICGVFSYFIYIKKDNKKLEVASAKITPSSNDDE